jgi:hypothetical protein
VQLGALLLQQYSMQPGQTSKMGLLSEIHNQTQAKRAWPSEQQSEQQDLQKRFRSSSTDPSSCSKLKQRGNQQGLSQQDAENRHGGRTQQVSIAEWLLLCIA